MQIADEVGTSKIIFDKMYFVLRSLDEPYNTYTYSLDEGNRVTGMLF